MAKYIKKELLLRIPAVALGVSDGWLGGATGFAKEHDFEIPEAEPGGVDDIMVMTAHDFWK